MWLQAWARDLKRQTLTLYFALRDPRTPLLPRLIAGAVVAYAISPIDLIPDFIPVLGYLDDIIIVPLGIWLAIRLVPSDVYREAQARTEFDTEPPPGTRAAIVIVSICIIATALCSWWAYITLFAT